MSDPKVITLEEAISLLGEDTVIALEPSQQWVFDPTTGRSGRLDGKFFDVRPFDRGGYWQLGIYEEPGLPESPEDGVRIVGNIKLSRNSSGLIKSRSNKGLDGNEFREAVLSSISNPEAVEYEGTSARSALIQANPQRIGGGFIRVFLVDEDFEDSEGVFPSELHRTTDGRTLAALAALDL